MAPLFNQNKLERNSLAGIGKITALVFGTIIAVIAFCAYNILPFYYYYFELISQMESVIKVASTETDQEIRRKLMYHIKKYQLPVDPDDLRIQRDAGMMKISLPYKEVFYVTWKETDYEIYTFEFNAYAEGRY